MNAVVDDTEILSILFNKRFLFENKYLTLVPADEDLSNLSWNWQDHLIRKIIISKADIISLCGNLHNYRDFFSKSR